MAVTYDTTTKNARLQIMNDRVCGLTVAASTGSGAVGTLVIGTSALTGATGVLASIVLQNPAFSISGGVATLIGVPLTVAATATGAAAKAEIRDNAGTAIITGLTVGTSATNIIVNSTSITISQQVTITAGTITHG